MCNIQEESPLSGASLLTIIEGNEKKWANLAFNQFGRPYNAVIGRKSLTHNGYSVRSDQYRLTLWFNQISGEIDARELYEMSQGIEKVNISGDLEYKHVEDQLTKVLLNFKNKKYITK